MQNANYKNANQIESGLIGAFRFFIAIRLLFWLLMRRVIMSSTAMSSAIYIELNALGIQAFWVTFVPDLLVLMVLSWPGLYQKINPRHFRWILALGALALLVGHAYLLLVRDFQNMPYMAAYFTPHSIFLFITILFVGWQYGWQAVLLYGTVVTATLLALLWFSNSLTIGYIITTLLMAKLTIFLPGWLIARMMTQQRQQQAALAAAAEEQARANEQLVHYAASLEELTISRERNRLARELHDTLAHSLSAVTVQLGAVETLWDQNPHAAKTLLTQADESARDGLEEARRALQSLRASPLVDLGLVLALATLANEGSTRAGATLHLELPEDNLTFLESHVEQGIYRIAQEALENSARHAEAEQIWVTLIHSVDQIELKIEDDGCGFDETKVEEEGHYGLTGMKERASVIGGMLQMESLLGEGTTVQLVVPLRGIKS